MSAQVDWRKAGEIVAEALSNTEATPGGGAGAGIAGAMGCGLGQMAVGISLRSKKLAPENSPGLEKALSALGRLRGEFHRLTGEDAAAFDVFMQALSLPKTDPERPERIQAALLHAAEVPLRTTSVAAEAAGIVTEAKPLTGAAVVSDMNCALHLLKAAALGAAENVRINLGGMKDKDKAKELEESLQSFLKGF